MRVLNVFFLLLGWVFLPFCTKPASPIPSGRFVKAEPSEVAINRPIRVFENEPKMLSLEYSFRDGDGNINSVSLTKIILNRNNAPATTRFVLPLTVSWPSMDSRRKQEGTVTFFLSYIELGGATRSNVDDTVRFALQLKDATGNESDTIFSPPIVILRTNQSR